MAMIPVSHMTEAAGGIQFPWIIRCQKCGKEVARLDQAELTAMVMAEKVEPVYCFDCEIPALVDKNHNIIIDRPQNRQAPWPTISVPRSLLGFI